MTDHEPIWLVVSDANVLASSIDRAILVYLNDSGLVALRWSSEIETELVNSALPKLGKTPEQIEIIIQELHTAIPEWEAVPGIGHYAKTSEVIDVPDRDDLVVLAAGLAAGASVILTKNLRDFTLEMAQRTRIMILHPDEFLKLAATEYPDYVITLLRELGRLSASNISDLLRNAGHSDSVVEFLENLMLPIARTSGTLTKRILKPRCGKMLPRAGVPCERPNEHKGKCRRYLKRD